MKRKELYLIIIKIMPFFMFFFFLSFLLTISYQDFNVSIFCFDNIWLFILSSFILFIFSIIVIYNIYSNQKYLSTSILHKDKKKYKENKKKMIFNFIFFIIFAIALFIFITFKDTVHNNKNYKFFDFYTHHEYISSLIVLILIRCYYGFLLFPEKVITFSQNLSRFLFILLGIIAPYTSYGYVSFSSVISATVASMIFDALLNNILDLYVYIKDD